MSAIPPDESTDARSLAELRQRVYAADATEADVARYRAVLAAQEPKPVESAEPPAETEPAATAESPQRRRRALLLVVPALAVVVGAVAVGAALSRRVPAPAPTPSSTDVVATLHVSSSARTDLEHAVDGGDGSVLSDYLLAHPEERPPQLSTLTRAASEEHTGVGGATVSLAPSTEADRGGRLTVILLLADAETATWRAARVDPVGGRLQQVAAHTATQRPGVPISTTVRYRGDAARLLSVSVPRGTPWDAFVVFSD